MIGRVLLLLLAQPGAGSGPLLGDADIAAYAASSYDKRAMMNRRILLGFHNGGRVAVTFPCSDVCPDYTTWIVHYTVMPGPGCGGLGGVLRSAIVPGGGPGSARRAYCVPAILGQEDIPLGGG